MKQKPKQPKQLNSPSRLPSWERRFNDLKAFKKEYGHCDVPHEYQPNLALGQWVANVRQAKKHGKLAEERVGRLNAFDFLWGSKRGIASAAVWEQRIRDLKAFKKIHGHCNVPCAYPPNSALGYWVASTRKRKKRGKLTEDRVRRLNGLGFCWEREVTWEQRIRDLKAFKKIHGHCNVPCVYPPNPALGHWVANLRQRKKCGELAEDRILMLDALGFSWSKIGMS
ncbi:MAG: helicase associated domain-containing protein [Planctomycetota bacterium]